MEPQRVGCGEDLLDYLRGMHPRGVCRRPRDRHDPSEPALASAHRAERVYHAKTGVERDVSDAGGSELVAEWIGRLDAERRRDAQLDDGSVLCGESDRADLDWLRHSRDRDGGRVPLDCGLYCERLRICSPCAEHPHRTYFTARVGVRRSAIDTSVGAG